MTDRLRIGVLGAARIVGQALVNPAGHVPEVSVAGIASRDPARARIAANRLRIPKVFPDYDALLADPDIDAVYVALPNALHGAWSVRAMESGKHVLCEKPVAANEKEARLLADVAERTGRIIHEAMHPMHHRLFGRIDEIIASGAIGEARHVEARVSFVIPRRDDIRWQYDLGGGAMMDLGSYAVTIMRRLAGMEPVTVDSAVARIRTPDVDGRMDARMSFANGATGRVVSAMWGWPLIAAGARLTGDRGTLKVTNPVGPHVFHRLTVTTDGHRTTERVAKQPDTYTCQLRAFAAAVATGTASAITGPAQFVATMCVIDEIYRAAGLPVRQPNNLG